MTILKINYCFSTVIVCLLLLNANAQALTEKIFVERLQRVHPFFTQLGTKVKIKQIEMKANTANQDWIIAVDTGFKSEDASEVSSITSYKDLDTVSMNVSATKKLIDSGINIVIKHNWEKTYKASTSGLNTNKNKFSIDYVQPLLKNSKGVNDRLDYDLASIDVQASKLDIAEKKEIFILIQLKKFIDLVHAQERLNFNNQRLKLSIQELALVKRRFDSSVVNKVDVLLQEDAYQKVSQQQLQAQQSLDLLRHEIAILLFMDYYNVVAKFDLYHLYTKNIVNLKQYLSANTRSLKIIDLNKKRLNRQLQSDKNNTQMQLDFKVGISTIGEKSNYYDSITKQSPSWRIGLGFSYPIGDTHSKSAVEKTSVQLRQVEEQRQSQLLDLYVKAVTAQQQIKYFAKLLKSSVAQIQIAKARTVEEKRRYDNGISQASFIISAQNNEQSVKLNYAQVASNYQKSILEFKAAIDQLSP